MATIIVVPKKFLKTAPEAFRQYVADYFVPKKVLGIKCMVASSHVICPSRSGGSESWGKGTAPRHNVDIRRYNEGLKKDQGLNDWMRQAEKRDEIALLDAVERQGNVYEVD